VNQTLDPAWIDECLKWRDRILTGHFIHYCHEYDGLPVDETCPEWPCGCYPENREERDQK